MHAKTIVLILEDVPSDAELAIHEINKNISDCDYKIVDNETDFKDALLNGNPDVIIADYSLPGYDGLSALKLAKELVPKTPLIIFTGSQNEDIAVECIKTGAIDYVIKEHRKRLGTAVLNALVYRKTELAKEQMEAKALAEQKLYEQKLIESEARAKAFLKHNPDLMFMFAPDGTVLDCHAENDELLIRNPTEIIGKNISELVPSNLSDLAMNAIKKVDTGNAVCTYEYELPVGKARYFESRFVRCGENKFLNIVRDITENKRVMELLRVSEERYRKIFETANEGILCIDDNCVISLLNQRTADMFGYSIEEILGKSIEYFMFNEDIKDHEKRIADRVSGKRGSYERRYFRKDGSTLWVIVSSSPEFDVKGNYIGSFGMLTDITERKIIEAKLKDSEGKYRRLFETANEGIWGVDSTGLTSFVNQKMASMLGFTIEEMIGTHVTQFIFPEDMPDYEIKTKERISGKHGSYDRRLKKKDGSIVWFNVSATPVIKKNGINVESYAMYTDITERIKHEKELQKTLERYQIQRKNMLKLSISSNILAGDIDALANEICQTTAETLNISRVGVWLFNESCTKLICRAMYDKQTGKLSSGIEIGEKEIVSEFEFLQTGNYLESENPVSDPRLKGIVQSYLIPNKISALLDAVIKSQGMNFGVVGLEFIDTPHHWHQDEISYACQLADQMSLVIEHNKRITAEKQLHESEYRYKQILEKTPIGIAIHSGGKVVYANPASAQIMAAKSPDEIIGMDIRELIHPDLIEQTLDRIKRLAAGEKGLYPNEEIFVRLDGTYVDVEVISSVIEYKNKPSFQVIASDITERKKAESEVKRNETRLKSIIDIFQHKADTIQDFINYAVRQAFVLTGSESGFLLFYDEEKGSLSTNHPQKISVKSGDKNIKKTEMKLNPKGLWGRIVTSHKPTIINDDESLNMIKNMMPSNHVTIKRFLSIPIIENDSIVAIVGVVNKQTDYDDTDVLQLTLLMDAVWKVVDAKLYENELRALNRAVEQSPVSIVVTNTDGNIEYVNEFFTKTTGFTINEALGQNLNILKSGKTPQETYDNLWETILSGKTWNGEFLNRKKNGEFYWENASISPVFNSEGNIINFISVKEDITERKNMTQELIKAKEEAEQMNKIKSSFLANMSHELRTPLVGILGYSELLTNMLHDEETKDMADTINISGKRLLHTLNLILDLSRIESNLQEVHWEIIELNSFLRDRVRLFEIVAYKKKLNLSYQSECSKLLLKTDSRLLEHVINDLINNAIKYTETGSVSVQLVINKSNDCNELQIKVIDTGIGIPVKQQSIIFDAFRQVSEGLDRAHEGTGLGLTICKRYVELLGGKIVLESKVGVGSTFIVCFPEGETKDIEETNTDESTKIATKMKVSHPHQSKLPHVLLIDDDEISYILFQKMLSGLVVLDYANNGQQALDNINQNHYSMVFLDINLPKGISGLEVLAKIRAMKEYKKTPVVAVTAYSMLGDKETFLAKGCTHYVSKPFSRDDLVSLLDTLTD